MTTRYPGAIDGYSDIRVVRDGIEEVLARDHNDNRSAIVAIEQTLGLNPQGTYGTVVARLDQADTDFAEHISGAAHRHVTNHIDYPGSGANTFQDGYAMIPARLGDTLDEIVARLGASTPAGSSGGDKIGTTPFVTEHSKYAFPESSVRGQLVDAGAFLDENATLLERALDSFVVDGMEVVDPYATGDFARIAAGHIVSDGRLLRYNGGELPVPPVGTFYVLARISNGSVLVDIEDPTLPSLSPLNPVVLLKKIDRPVPGLPWVASLSTDIRRFGALVNNKNFFTVGNTPGGGADGYGCDFLSLKGAVDYLYALAVAGRMITPRKLMLVSNLAINSDDDLAISIELRGLEIDGCGKTITANGAVTQPLFLVREHNVYIHDLTLVTNTVYAPSISFAHIADTSSLYGIKVVRCGMLSAAGAGEFFLRLGDAGGLYSVDESLFTENIVDVENGGIVYASANPFAQTLTRSLVVGNHIYQSSLNTFSGYHGIQASAECIVSDNIVHGGFSAGISIHAAGDTVKATAKVSDNLVVGTPDCGMTTGIAVFTDGPTGDTSGTLVAGNTILCVWDYGIDLFASGIYAGRSSIIADNIIDNSVADTFSTNTAGIRAGRVEIPVIGNKISTVGYPILATGIAMNNEIFGHGMPAGNGILCMPGGPTAMVCYNHIYGLDCSAGSGCSAINADGSNEAVIAGNVIKNCIGYGSGSFSAGINMGSTPGARATITGNIIYHSTVATGMMGISNIGSGSIVADNLVVKQQDDAIAVTSYGADPKANISIVGNRAYNCGSTGIRALDATNCVIADNALIINDPSILSPGPGIYGFGDYSIVSGNIVRGYGGGGYSCIYSSGGYNSCIVANNMIVYPYDAPFSTDAAISLASWTDALVTGNMIGSSIGKGISLSGTMYSMVTDNIITAFGGATTIGIANVDSGCLVANNQILGYGTTLSHAGIRVAMPAPTPSTGIVIADNFIMGQSGTVIDLNYASATVVTGNYMQGSGTAGPALLNYGEASVLANNFMLFCGADADSIIIQASDAPLLAASETVVAGNLLYACQGSAIFGGFWEHQIIANNLLIGTGTSKYGIAGIGDFTMIVNNMISDYVYGAEGIAVLGTNCAVVGNILLNQNGFGIRLVSGANNGVVSGNYVSAAYIVGISIENAGEALVCNNYVIDTEYGIVLDGAGLGQVIGNHITSAWANGITLQNFSAWSSVCGNHIVNSGTFMGICYGIRLDASTDWCLIANNLVFWHYGPAISTGLSDGHNIVGNATFQPQDDMAGIDLQGSVDVLLVGNRCECYGVSPGFWIDPVPFITAAGNLSINDPVGPVGFAFGHAIDFWSCRYG